MTDGASGIEVWAGDLGFIEFLGDERKSCP
jgi:hypothetical protein